MSIRKTSRILLIAAAIGAMSQLAQAGCNCSVPPSPAAFGGGFGGQGLGWGGSSWGGSGWSSPAWGGGVGYDGGSGSYGMTGHPGSYGSYGMPGYAGSAGYDGMAPAMPPVAMPQAASPGYGYGPGGINGGVPYNPSGATWAPGGYEARIGSPVYYHDPAGGQYVVTGNPYNDHFGPGFQRHSLYGHYRFPYYNYRAPWYYSGKAVYNRDTNFPW